MTLTPENAKDAIAERLLLCLSHKEPVLAALDGMAASGKTTLARELSRALPCCSVVHMDDFFLPPQSRSAAHFEQTLANADVERVYRDVLYPLSNGQSAVYQPYVPHPMPHFLPPVRIQSRGIVLIEGAYSLHPSLYALYDLHMLEMVSDSTQRARILARDGEEKLSLFLHEWIPMENLHIEKHALVSRCDLVIRVP